MFQIVITNRFKKDVKILNKRGYNMQLLKNAIVHLENSGTLPNENNPHKLSGNFSNYWEAHIKSDWLLIWKVVNSENEIWLTRTGTHSDLF